MDEADWRGLADDYGPSAILVAIAGYMVWIRTLAASRAITDEGVRFSGNDPWYHARVIRLTVEHFPETLTFDPWSFFPYGTGRHSGFGGLFDQLVALAALIVGAGNPSPHLVDVVTAYAPVAFGVATIFPVYLIAKRLLGRWGALVPVVLLALFGGQFLSRTVVVFSDHHAGELFFGSVAVLGFVYVVETVYAEKPTIEDLRDRNRIVLRRPVIAALLGGVAMGSYLMTWPPGVMLAFTLGMFVVLQMIVDYVDGTPNEYLALGTAGSMFLAGLITLLYAKTYTLESTAFSLLQPLVVVGIGAGALVLVALARYFDEEGYDERYYPAAVVALVAGAFALMAVVYPPSVGMLESLVVRIYSFGLLASPSGLTVAEIQPASLTEAWRAFGVVFFVALLGALLLLVRVVQHRRPVELLILLWSFTMFSAYFTMSRFGYYLAVNVAILAGLALWWAGTNLLELDTVREASDLETYQVLGIVIILIAVLPGNVIAVSGSAPAWQTAENPNLIDRPWHDELGWMGENTPDVPLDYDRHYETPDDGDFEYPEAAYGVMSWWDYGHWITHRAQRIPNANPFQEGPQRASAYFLSDNETHANLLLDALPTLDRSDLDVPLGDVSDEQLRTLIDEQDGQQANEDTRYVVIDDQMAGGKFSPIATWTGPGANTYFQNEQYGLSGGDGMPGENVTLPATNDRYDETMLSRLYFGDASGLEHYRLVHEANSYSIVGGAVNQATGDLRSRISFRVGGFQQAQIWEAQLAQANQQNQLFGPITGNWLVYDTRVASSVKTYERVEGAQISGTANVTNETTIFATVPLQTNTGRTFTYVQQTETDEDGNFELTVPYATTDDVGPEDGGTNAGVTANGTYTVHVGFPGFHTEEGHVDVPEEAIYEGDGFDVELEEVERQPANDTDGNGTDGNGTVDDATNGNETVENDTDGNGTDGNESALGSPTSSVGSSLAGERLPLIAAEP